MKNLLLVFFVFTLLQSCNKQEALPPNTYEITGTAKGVINGLRAYIKVFDSNRREQVMDTAIVMNESFTFTGKTLGNRVGSIEINSLDGNLSFVLQSGRTSIEINKDSIYASKVYDNENNELFTEFKSNQRKIYGTLKSLEKEIKDVKFSNNTKTLPQLYKKRADLRAAYQSTNHQFIEAHPRSTVSLLLLEDQVYKTSSSIETLKKDLILLNDVITENKYNKAIGEKIKAFIAQKEAQNNLKIGKTAPNFTSITPEGKTLSLNDIKGKATIIDFWASWCGPCRRENPNVVKVYEKYHDKGLEIISVSLDKPNQKERWLKAIKDDKLTWHHVGELKYFNDPVARMYNINSIPATFVLDAEGKIVAKKLRGNALEQQIAKMLD